MENDIYRSSRRMYILEAAIEYFISILVSGAYFARLTTAIGMSDSLTGVLSSLTSLGCSFQLLAIFFGNKRGVKRSVAILHSINQLCFTLIYIVPFFEFSSSAKIVLFIALILSGRIVDNIVQPIKINWFMSLVDDSKRGRFTANKEIVSLIGGMVFSFVMGTIADGLTAAGKERQSFIVCGITLLVLTALHSYTLLASKEKLCTEKEAVPMKQMLLELVKDKSFIKIALVSVLWNIATYASTPFFGTYAIKELGFSMTLISLLSALYAICRSLFSRPLGKYADRTSFAKMLNICFVLELLAFVVSMFTVPSNGMIFYAVYYMLSAMGMAGINSGAINLIYERVSKEKRVCALALKNTLAGLAGFATTLIFSLLVERIQANGNRFLGLDVYAQQVTSAISAIVVVITIIYLNTVVKKMALQRN